MIGYCLVLVQVLLNLFRGVDIEFVPHELGEPGVDEVARHGEVSGELLQLHRVDARALAVMDGIAHRHRDAFVVVHGAEVRGVERRIKKVVEDRAHDRVSTGIRRHRLVRRLPEVAPIGRATLRLIAVGEEPLVRGVVDHAVDSGGGLDLGRWGRDREVGRADDPVRQPVD
jgi:hypothetical protein